MSNKIFKSIWIAAITVFLASLVLIFGVSYSYFSKLQKDRLKSETELAAQGVALSGASFFDDLDTENYRVTWIDADGNVLYDNEADSQQMGNHLEREEVKEALVSGYGEATRYSSTLAEKQFYAAKRLPDGSILRLSIVQMTVWMLMLGFAQPICIVILLALILSFVLASRLARRIVKPINEMDLENPGQYIGVESYAEVEPLLRRIVAQQNEIRRDQDRIEETALIRQEFSANVSHELKTPLHAISGYAELIEKDMVKEADIKPFASKIREESSRLTKLVEDIIDLTKLDNGATDQKWECCNLYRVAQNAVDSLQMAAANMDVKVRLAGVDVPVTGVPQMLYSIIYNLCDNAIKYNHRGGSVDISVNRDNDNAIVSVKDTGIGIPNDSKERVFERFYRVDKSRSKAAGGTGLGLSIVKHAVLVHKGKIELENRPEGGTEFKVTLPVSSNS